MQVLLESGSSSLLHSFLSSHPYSDSLTSTWSMMAMTMLEAKPVPPSAVHGTPSLSGIIVLSVIYGYHKTASVRMMRYIDEHRT